MTIAEASALSAVSHSLPELRRIADSLETLAKLKAIEIKAAHPEVVSAVDAVLAE